MRNELNGCLCGMAIMSTHPRDFQPVLDLEKDMMNNADNDNGNGNNNVMRIIPCLGVHPWFLHELEHDDWEMVPSSSSSSSSSRCKSVAVRDHDCDNSNNHDGNINDDTVDNNNDNNSNNNILSSSSSTSSSSSVIIQQQQQQAIRMVPKWIANLEEYIRQNPHVPVGEIGLDGFHFDFDTKELTTPMEKQIEAFKYQLQLATTYHRPKIKNNNTSKVYFGFAPVINLNVHSCSKTMDVIRAVGIHRLVLETDHEDIQNIQSSMELGIDIISTALDCTPAELIRITNNNINDLYNISI
ncbi:Metallo-dependent hydrolase [Fragilariopsis cylindrus CCMP1102]|uniref:Metallo-dependent hydrolase n=1 Tax=Fragilariopsis cylindrus CCMP1102 TaxID=635003 RepID=A0A1E7FFV3_9STRA|nr:Metallo-dependent hydrolase [Fragilariopsis cylindrus CCMP1102]|eukprot:OEU17048.1 Metallo-dependent hydrolase [Fragilariopsis cylindrus CCMP1102]